MAQIRKYFTYIPNIVVNSDYPGGAYSTPHKFFEVHYGPTETLHEDDMFKAHKDGEDCRVLAWVEGDDTHLANGASMTVTEFAITEGLKNFNSTMLSDADALALAQIFSPSRTVQRLTLTGDTVTDTINACSVDGTGKIVQTVTPGV